MLTEDPNGEKFPWTDPPLHEILSGPLLKSASIVNGTQLTTDFESLKSCVKAFYFGAKWCPPSRTATKQLLSVYEKLRHLKQPFEIIFCSLDRTKASFEEYFSTMPWLAFPYNDHRMNDLIRVFDVNGMSFVRIFLPLGNARILKKV